MFIAYALAGKAHFIVSGDDDLLDLEQVNGVHIVTPAEFLAALTLLAPVSSPAS